MTTPKKTSPLIARSKSIQAELNSKAALVVQSLRNKRHKDDIPSDSNSMANSRKHSLDNIKVPSSHSDHNVLRKLLKSPMHMPKNLGSFGNKHSDVSHSATRSLSSLNSGEYHCPKSLGSPNSTNSVETFGALDVPLTPGPGSFDHSLSVLSDPLASPNTSSFSKNPTSSSLSLPNPKPRRATLATDELLPENSLSPEYFGHELYKKDSVPANSSSSNMSEIVPAPAPAMYWQHIQEQENQSPNSIRSHSSTLVGDQLFILGGVNSKACYNDVHIFDTDTMYWSQPRVTGTPPSPRRAHSATLVDDTNIFVFGGGNASTYFNDLYVLNTVSLSWSSPPTYGDIPAPRRAHTACCYKDSLYIFGGGDGLYPLNDLYRLDLTTNNGYEWSRVMTGGRPPSPRGYHSSTLLESGILIIYGGSDGTECFDDIHLLDLESLTWKEFPTRGKIPLLAHSATAVGPFLYIFGGRNRTSYSDNLLILNLQQGTWESRKVFGAGPSPRGYHTTILYDARIFLFGGFDGSKFYNEMNVLDLSASAYLSQIQPLMLSI